ncbi:MAG: prepilin-type N-terminal cleavage/methylation domain-containing protein [Moraxellaceae bacterium]
MTLHRSERKGAAHVQGFTLLELIVTVLIVGILAAIAVPNYKNYVQRSAVSESQQRMLGLSTDLLRWRSKTLTYKGFVPAGGYVEGSDTDILVPTGSSLTDYRYKITLVDASADASLESEGAVGIDWVMIAVPNSGNATLKDGSQLYLRSNGQRCLVPSVVGLSTGVNPCGDLTSQPWN